MKVTQVWSRADERRLLQAISGGERFEISGEISPNNHALRHTTATIMLDSGDHVKLALESLGYVSTETTLAI